MGLRAVISRWRERRSASIFSLVSGYPGVPGDPVTATNIEWIPAVQRAVTLIASDVARLPMRVVHRQPDGTVVEQPGPQSDLLTRQPTQSLHSYAWRQHIVRTYMIHGNCVCWMQKSGRGLVLQLVPLEPNSVRIEHRDSGVVYIHEQLGELAPSEVLHFRMPGGQGGLWGEGLLDTGRESLTQLRNQQQVAASIAANTVQPRVVLKHPGKLSEQMALAAKSKFEQTFSGTGAGGTVLLQDGMSVEQMTVKATDAEFISSINHSIAEVARLTGVPLPMLHELSRATYSNVVELNRSYLHTCLEQHLSMISAEVRAKFLPWTRDLEFDTTALTKGTLSDQVTAYAVGIDRGVVTRNEARIRLGLNPIDGLDAPVLRLDTAETDAEDEEPTDAE